MPNLQHPSDPGFGIYVHWPFCAAKCPYCDFNSHVRAGGIDEARYRDALIRELQTLTSRMGRRTVSSIFFGGGTPSLMSPSTVAGIIDAIARLHTLAPDAEITLEANPSSVEAERFRGYRDAGVNRVSLGVQSLDDRELKSLGRLHSVAEARAAIAIAQTTFDRTSFDLIYARPGQSSADRRRELSEALAMAGTHLSLYQLTIEPETPFAKLHAAGKLVTPDPDASLALYDITQELTTAHGLPLYEISNHARPGHECRHNLIYWRYGEYAGIGPGAHGRVVAGGIREATVTIKGPEQWLKAVEVAGEGVMERTALTPAEEADEMLLMGLRLDEGLSLARLAKVTGHIPAAPMIDELVDIGMIDRIAEGTIRATGEGRFVLNAIVAKLAGALASTSTGGPAGTAYGSSSVSQ